jgi:hypothetical protein
MRMSTLWAEADMDNTTSPLPPARLAFVSVGSYRDPVSVHGALTHPTNNIPKDELFKVKRAHWVILRTRNDHAAKIIIAGVILRTCNEHLSDAYYPLKMVTNHYAANV